ncbi:MAG: DUF1178 family protein [Alphaproteobacteria bacterium]
MILYDLRCRKSHLFEVWFKDSAAFDEQVAARQIACPVCNDRKIVKAPMAPRINRPKEKGASDRGASETVAMGEALKALREFRRQVEANFENVGERFADEARKMHYGEKETRNIYGDATPDETDALKDEGIPVERIPWVPKGDA